MSLEDAASACSELGCDAAATARGLCGRHYQRRRAAGSLPEDWPSKGRRKRQPSADKPGSHAIRNPDVTARIGVCVTCGPVKIRVRRRTSGAYLFECIPYRRAKAKDYPRAPAPRARRRSALKLKYGLTLDGYDAMLMAQGGGCAICGEAPQGQILAVDHDHATGIVRGILCKDCNVAIGWLRDSPARALAAHRYLLAAGQQAA